MICPDTPGFVPKFVILLTNPIIVWSETISFAAKHLVPVVVVGGTQVYLTRVT